MIITFSEKAAAKFTNPDDPRYAIALDALVESVVERISVENYRMTWQSDSPIGNVYAAITWSRGRRVRFTLETRDASAHGSRTASSGRHMRKASWEAHRDVLRALFQLDPQAVVRTALATYSGKADFERSHPATADASFSGYMGQRPGIRSTTV